MYTQRHFESVAAMLLEFRDKFANTEEGAAEYGWLVGRFSRAFSISNPKFNQEIFDKACGWTTFKAGQVMNGSN